MNNKIYLEKMSGLGINFDRSYNNILVYRKVNYNNGWSGGNTSTWHTSDVYYKQDYYINKGIKILEEENYDYWKKYNISDGNGRSFYPNISIENYNIFRNNIKWKIEHIKKLPHIPKLSGWKINGVGKLGGKTNYSTLKDLIDDYIKKENITIEF